MLTIAHAGRVARRGRIVVKAFVKRAIVEREGAVKRKRVRLVLLGTAIALLAIWFLTRLHARNQDEERSLGEKIRASALESE